MRRWHGCGCLLALMLSACGGSGGGGGGASTPTALASLQAYGLSAFARNAGITLDWPRVSGATSYNLYWATSSGGLKTKIANVTPPYAHGVLVNGSPYYYTYTVVRTEGESAYSTELAFVPNNNSSTAPSDLLARAGNGQVELTWSGVAGATSYNVYWGITHGVTTASTQVADVTSPFVLTGRTNDTPVYFVVTAVIGGTESGVSREVAATPYAPEPQTPDNVTATAGNAQVSVSWDAVANATSYSLLWSASAAVTASANRVDNVTAPYVHTGLTNGQHYYYALVALNSRGPSPLSGEVDVQPSATPSGTPVPATLGGTAPDSPRHVKAFAGHLQNTITADDDASALRYTIYWDTDSTVTSADTAINDVTLPYTHTGLTDGTPVYYRVVAMNRYGASDLSTNTAAATPQNTPVSAVSFPDAVLQACVTAAAADHGWNYAREFESLICNQIDDTVTPTVYTDIADLTGVDALSNLETLEIGNDGDYDAVVAPVENLLNLSQLALEGVQLSNADAVDLLAPLLHLTWLDLYLNQVTDLEPLRTKVDLETLYLGANGISNIEPLSGLTSLQLLWLNINTISNISVLSGLTQLTELSLADNNVASASALSSMTGLTRLSLADNQIVDVSPLSSLTALLELYLSGNAIGGSGVGKVDTLSTLVAATAITLTGNITMSCSELAALIGTLGSPPVDMAAADSTPVTGNCTNP